MNRMHSKPGRRGPGVALGTLLALTLAALLPAAAQARPPRIDVPPVIAGTAEVGATLVAEGAEWSPHGKTTATWQWLRCDGATGESGSCTDIAGATTTSYTVTAADVGHRLRVALLVVNDEGSATYETEPTAPVPAAPGPVSSPTPVPQPAPAPVFEVREERAASAPRMMNPAPIVRIRGRLTATGARITLLTVRAPRGARITVRCVGRRCPARRWAGTASLTRIARFQRALRAGTRIVITVTKRRRIGKHTVITVRRGAAPTRRDRCLMPGDRTPVRCPAV